MCHRTRIIDLSIRQMHHPGTHQASAPQFAVQYHYDGVQGRDRLLLSTSDTQGRVTLLEVEPQGGLVPILQVNARHSGTTATRPGP